MKKFIVKTAVITLITVFALFVVFVTAMTVIAPRAMSDFFYGIGNEGVSAWYMELSYQKTDSSDDLVKLVQRSVEAEDYKRVKKYAKAITEREDFKEICEKNTDKNGKLPYDIYLYSNYAVALYKTGAEKTQIFAVADNSVANGYAYGNAYQVLLYRAVADKNGAFLAELKTKYDEMTFEDPSFIEDKGFLNDEIQKGENNNG